MKTTYLLFVMLLILFSSCSNEEDDLIIETGKPEISFDNDTIRALFLSPGTFFIGNYNSKKIHVNWNHDKGIIEIESPNDVIQYHNDSNEIGWGSLDVGYYQFTLTAINAKGEAKENFVLEIVFGGDFILGLNNDPMDRENLFYIEDAQSVLIYGNQIYVHDWFGGIGGAIVDLIWENDQVCTGKPTRYFYGLFYPDSIRCFKVNLSYDDAGVPFLSGYWYTTDEPVDGLEGGYIEFKQ